MLTSSSGVLMPTQSGVAGQLTAAAFMVRNVNDACIVGRIIAFHTSAGLGATWALVDEEDVDATGRSRLEDAGVQVARQPRVPDSWLSFGGPRSGSSKPSFVAWLAHQGDYSHAWHLEDDVFYTGAWRRIVDGARWARADVVALLSAEEWTGHWAPQYASKCRLADGVSCQEGTNRTDVTKVWWPAVRLSRDFAKRLSAALDGGASGHHEILTGAVCDQLSGSGQPCVATSFSKEDLGVYSLGGWGRFNCLRAQWAKAQPSELTAERRVPCETAWPPSIAEATAEQPGRLYHPVKCYQNSTFEEMQREWSLEPTSDTARDE